jgi:uncharacterized membrane protein YadS
LSRRSPTTTDGRAKRRENPGPCGVSAAIAAAAAGALAGEDALQIATIVKTTQNALIGVVAIALTAYFAFVLIGLESSLKGLREAGWRPIALFASATVVNIVVALGLAAPLFGSFTLG